MPKKVFQPFAITLVIGGIAALSFWTQQGWLAPSLAAAAFLQVFSPDQPAAQPYALAGGQIIGAIAGFIGVLVTSSTAMPLFTGTHHLVLARLLAVVVAVALASVGQLAAKATSPAGGATALVIAMGAETTTWAGAGRLLVGIILVTALGELARRIVLLMG